MYIYVYAAAYVYRWGPAHARRHGGVRVRCHQPTESVVGGTDMPYRARLSCGAVWAEFQCSQEAIFCTPIAARMYDSRFAREFRPEFGVRCSGELRRASGESYFGKGGCCCAQRPA